MEDNNNSLPAEIKDLLHYHKKGTEYIKKALSIDENSSEFLTFFFFMKNFLDSFILLRIINFNTKF